MEISLKFSLFFSEYDLLDCVNSRAIFRHVHISLWMGSYSFGKGAMGAIRNSLRFSDDIRQRFLSLEKLWRSHISVHSQITGQAWPSTHRMHSFRKVSARISAGGFCSVEIWVFWMDDFYEMEFYSSRIKLALLWGSGYFLYEWWILRWLWNAGLVYPSLPFFET